uniref:Putative PAS/PAC sensor protein n=1 Tax=Rhodopseudomonas palustris (strain BisA53) TaxID=316055 RepID=Q07RZ0_RHOP5
MPTDNCDLKLTSSGAGTVPATTLSETLPEAAPPSGGQPPDVTLLLDMDGVIRDATVSPSMARERLEGWVGQAWVDVAGHISGDKIQRMMDDARNRGISAFRQIDQRFPSGLELPMEFTTMVLGDRTGMLVIGKSVQAVAELNARLIAAQQAIERDHWRLREVETRYRLVFDGSNEAVVILDTVDFRILEANAAALQLLGSTNRPNTALVGRNILLDVAAADRDAVHAMLVRVRERGKALGIVVHFGPDAKPWMLRGSMLPSDAGQVLLLHFTSALRPIAGPEQATIKALFDQIPDGFVALDSSGIIRHANPAFLDLVQVGSKAKVIGASLERWLSAPGADFTALLAQLKRHATVRLFRTTLRGELGTESEVEISAVKDNDPGAHNLIGVLLRDVSRRIAEPETGDLLRAALGPVGAQLGKSSLRKLVKQAVSIVEQHYVKEALELARGNRTATAELLGLSRQSLYAKLNRYGLDDREPAAQEISED